MAREASAVPGVPFSGFRNLIYRHLVDLLGWGSTCSKVSTHTEQTQTEEKKQTCINDVNEIWTHDPSLWAVANNTRIRPRYHWDNWDRLIALLKRLVAAFPPRCPGFASGQHLGFVVDKVTLGHGTSEYFGFPCQSFHQFFIIIVTRGWHNRPLVAAVLCGPNWTPPPIITI
jgi:hypothetical protein